MAEKNKFKTWFFIVLFLFISQTIFVGWLFVVGTEVMENEVECSNVVCGNKNYDTFYYDYEYSICYCYKDGEIELSQKM